MFKVRIYGIVFSGSIVEIKEKIEQYPTYGDVIENLEEVRKEGSWYFYNQGAQHWDRVPDERIPRFPN